MTELPRHVVEATRFAEILAAEHERRHGDMKLLFVILAGLASARDKRVAADCLATLDRAFFPSERG
jgi:hypothetical protein